MLGGPRRTSAEREKLGRIPERLVEVLQHRVAHLRRDVRGRAQLFDGMREVLDDVVRLLGAPSSTLKGSSM
jgi:hypothetical protein